MCTNIYQVLMKTNIQTNIQIMKHQKQNINQHEKHKHDYYVNSHVIRAMINMIAKQW